MTPTNTRLRTRTIGEVVIAFVLAVALAALLSACSAGKAPSAEDQVPRVVAPDVAGSGGVIHGAGIGDRLDDTNEPSLPLKEAIARTRSDLSLPDEALTGKIVKVVLNETVEDKTGKGRVGVMILFESGVKLFTEPGAKDLEEYNESFRTALPFRDGRELPCELKTVGGRPTLVGAAGFQYNERGDIPTPATLLWNVGDVNYYMKAPLPPRVSGASAEAMAEGAATQEDSSAPVDVDDLVRMAESLELVAR